MMALDLIYSDNNSSLKKKKVSSVLEALSFLSLNSFTPQALGKSLSLESWHRTDESSDFYYDAVDIIQNFIGEKISLSDIEEYDFSDRLKEMECRYSQ